jgi:hypothetical protein
MELATRPFITAGVVLTSASLIAATPVHARLPDLRVPAIQLTAGFDPIAEWEQVLQQALANATDIWDHWSPAPFPALQQVLVNQVGYLEEVLKNPSTIADIPTQIEDNFNAAVNAAITPFTPVDPEPYIYPSLDPTPIVLAIRAGLVNLPITLAGKAGLLDVLENGFTFSLPPFGSISTPALLPLLLGDQLASQVVPYLDFAGSPLSGVLWGGIGTLLSPALQFSADVTAISDALDSSTPDFTTAFEDLVNAPANITGAFLNGFGDIPLSTLLADLGITGVTLPPGLSADIDLGGLLSPGGSLLNGIGFSDSFTVATLPILGNVTASIDVPGTAVGPIASMIGLDQAIAEAIGWSGVGNPLEALLNLF